MNDEETLGPEWEYLRRESPSFEDDRLWDSRIEDTGPPVDFEYPVQNWWVGRLPF